MSLEEQLAVTNAALAKIIGNFEKLNTNLEKLIAKIPTLPFLKEGPPAADPDEVKPAAKPATKPAAKAKPAPTPEPEAVVDPDGGDDDDPKTEISVNYLSDKVKALAAATNREAVIAIFKLFGAERLPDITKDKYPALDLALTKAISKAKEVK